MTNIIFRPNFSYGKTDNLSNSESGTFNSDPYSLVSDPNNWLNLEKIFNPDDDPLRSIRINAINSGSLSDNKSVSTDATLQLNRKLNDKGRNVTFRGRFGYTNNDNNQYTESETHYFQLLNALGGDSILVRNQYITTPTKNYNYSAQLTYSEPIARATFLQFSYQFQYKYSESDKTTYDLQGFPDWGLSTQLPTGYEEHAVDSLGKYAEYRYYNHDASVSLRFIREKYQLSAGMSFQPQHSVLSYKRGDYMIDTTRNVFNFAPNLDLRIRFSKVSQLRMTYRGRSSQPSMENLLPIVDNSNPQNVRIGNPGLKLPSRTTCDSSIIRIMPKSSAVLCRTSTSRQRRIASAIAVCTIRRLVDGLQLRRISTVIGMRSACLASIRHCPIRSIPSTPSPMPTIRTMWLI